MGNGLCATEAVEPTEEVRINLENAFTPNSAKVETVGTGVPTGPTVPGLPPGDWDGKPLFEHIPETMSEEERQHILQHVVLSDDPSSKHFARREKAIRFATVINGRVQTFTQNYFLQDVEYNDFSGGYRRYYALINEELFEPGAPIAKVVLNFAKYYSIPEKTAILIQIQTNIFDQLEGAKSRASVTGQGIHTDGADRAMIVCLHRGELLEGCENVFHGSLNGMEELSDEIPLKDREGLFFKDNSLYHTVTRAGIRGKHKNLEQISRTSMIMHAPAEIYMQGLSNPNNNLGANEAEVQLRDESFLRKREARLTTHMN